MDSTLKKGKLLAQKEERAFQEVGECAQGCGRWEYGILVSRRREIRRDGTRREEKEIMRGGGGGCYREINEEARPKVGLEKSQKDFNNINNFTSEFVWQQAAHLFYH